MTIKKFVYITLFISSTNLLYSQCDLQEYLDLLASSSLSDRIFALEEIRSCNMTDALGTLEEYIHTETNFTVKRLYLDVISYLGSDNITEITFEFLNEIEDFDPSDPFVDIKEARLDATLILFNEDDYSTAEYVFDYMETNSNLPSLKIYPVLEKIILNVPAYESHARSKLTNYVQNSSSYFTRAFSLTYLIKHYADSQIQNICLDIASNDDSMGVRLVGLKGLSKTNYVGLRDYLITRLSDDPSWYLRHIIADSILIKYGEPRDLKTIIDYLPNESDPKAYSTINHSIQDFIPPQPGEDVTTKQMITHFIGFVEDLMDYEWILPNAQFDFLNHAQEVYNAYYNEQPGVAVELLLEIIGHAEESLPTEEITQEGYKFLHYYPEYIIARLEGEG
jgi:hypothetical protein